MIDLIKKIRNLAGHSAALLFLSIFLILPRIGVLGACGYGHPLQGVRAKRAITDWLNTEKAGNYRISWPRANNIMNFYVTEAKDKKSGDLFILIWDPDTQAVTEADS